MLPFQKKITERRRAAWSVVQFNPCNHDVPFRTIILQHVQGDQTTSRAELAAIAWVIQTCANQSVQQQVVITTDSQYAISTIQAAVQDMSRPLPPNVAHVDLLNNIRFQPICVKKSPFASAI